MFSRGEVGAGGGVGGEGIGGYAGILMWDGQAGLGRVRGSPRLVEVYKGGVRGF